jgi:hypothetical protein
MKWLKTAIFPESAQDFPTKSMSFQNASQIHKKSCMSQILVPFIAQTGHKGSGILFPDGCSVRGEPFSSVLQQEQSILVGFPSHTSDQT